MEVRSLNFNEKHLRLYAVTAGRQPGGPDLARQVEAALQGGATMVQLREKDRPRVQLLPLAKQLAALCRRYGAPLIINDDVALAMEADADGVHLGQQDLPAGQARALLGAGKILGVSAHNAAEAQAALRAGADYLGAGAVFATGTKPDARPLSIETLRSICAVGLPVAAIGGIDVQNLPRLAGSGIAGAAVAGALFGAPDITAAARRLRAAAETVCGK